MEKLDILHDLPDPLGVLNQMGVAKEVGITSFSKAIKAREVDGG